MNRAGDGPDVLGVEASLLHVSKNDEFTFKNEEFCISKTRKFVLQMMNFAGRARNSITFRTRSGTSLRSVCTRTARQPAKGFTPSTVRFQYKNPDFLLKNPDLMIRNLDFLLKNVDFKMKPVALLRDTGRMTVEVAICMR